jgi:hypothetical protein
MLVAGFATHLRGIITAVCAASERVSEVAIAASPQLNLINLRCRADRNGSGVMMVDQPASLLFGWSDCWTALCI